MITVPGDLDPVTRTVRARGTANPGQIVIAPSPDPLLTATPINFSITSFGPNTGFFAAECNLFLVSGTGPTYVTFANLGNVPVAFLRYANSLGFGCPAANFPTGEIIPPNTSRPMPVEWFTNTSYMVSWPAGASATDTVYWTFTELGP
jgi:hypothetical protein